MRRELHGFNALLRVSLALLVFVFGTESALHAGSQENQHAFDAAREPPPANAPDRYDTWSGALITTFFGDAYGVRLGASYQDVLQWLPRFRPYETITRTWSSTLFTPSPI